MHTHCAMAICPGIKYNRKECHERQHTFTLSLQSDHAIILYLELPAQQKKLWLHIL